jgi:TrmH family RNA methyltransferase
MPVKNYRQITSPQNSYIKLLERLKIQKHRRKEQKFMVENLAIIFDALESGYDFEALFITEEFALKHKDKLTFLQRHSRSQNFYLVDSKLNKLYSSLDTAPGIAAIYLVREKKLSGSPVVYLNGISDPGNLGAIMRSALAFNFINFVIDRNCADIHNPKVISAAKDAIFKLNIIEDNSDDWLHKNELPVYAASAQSGFDLSAFKPAQTFCLVLGNESHGISTQIMRIADNAINIKISPQIESLNVAAAAAILFYELGKK